MKTGKIHLSPSDSALIEKQMTKLSNGEYDAIINLPEEERPRVLALRRYCQSRYDIAGRAVGIQEKNAFRLGFLAGVESTGKGK